MFSTRKKHRFLKIVLILIVSASIGMFLGYASVRYKHFPFYEKLNQGAQKPKEEETVTIPTPEPVYASVSENNKIELPEAPSPAPPPENAVSYMVKSENSKVYLFKTDESGNSVREQLLPINLNALKEEDKKLFLSGIPIKNKQELASVLEDFGS